MYRYLLDHPDILPCKVKEPQFFSKSVWKRWLKFRHYETLFPRRGSRDDITLDWFILNDTGEIEQTEVHYKRSDPEKEITGEASANTFYDVPAARLRSYYPKAKAIVMFRDPVRRAWSHYRMFQRFADEGRRLPFQLTGFHHDIHREIDHYISGKRSYFLGQGVYADRLPDWQNIFGPDLYVVFAEELRRPDMQTSIMNELTDFLGIDRHDFTGIMKREFNVAQIAAMDKRSEDVLREFYLPHDKLLQEILNRQLPWHE